MKKIIRVGDFKLGPEEKMAINEVLDSGRLSEGEKVRDFEDRFHKYLEVNARELLNQIRVKKELTEDVEEKLKRYIAEFKQLKM